MWWKTTHTSTIHGLGSNSTPSVFTGLETLDFLSASLLLFSLSASDTRVGLDLDIPEGNLVQSHFTSLWLEGITCAMVFARNQLFYHLLALSFCLDFMIISHNCDTSKSYRGLPNFELSKSYGSNKIKYSFKVFI